MMPVSVLQQPVRLSLFFVLLTLLSAPVNGQELDDVLSGFDSEPAAVEENSEELDDLLSGFDETVSESEAKTGETAAGTLPAWLQLNGRLLLAGSFNFAHSAPVENEADFRGLSMLRTLAGLEGDIRYNSWQARISGHAFYDAAYSIQGRDQYSGRLLDSYEQELEIEDFYLAGSLTRHLDMKTGRQIVVWGKSDNVRVTDVLNPLDQRLPGMVDIKDLRLPVTMSKLDYYLGSWNLSGIMLHEVRFSKTPVYNSDFFPAPQPLPPEEKPDNSLDNQQYGLALNGIFSGWDLSLYSSWIFDDRAHLVQTGDGDIYRQHSRLFMTGTSGNVAMGNWLLKGEGALFDGLEYGSVPDQKFARLDLMVGVEYTGFSETVLSLEVVNRHIIDFDEQLRVGLDSAQENSLQSVAKFVRDFANDTVQIKILLSVFGGHGEDGAFERFQLDYDLTDAVTLTGGVLFYQSSDQGAFIAIDDNDRGFFEVVYEF